MFLDYGVNSVLRVPDFVFYTRVFAWGKALASIYNIYSHQEDSFL